MKHVKYLVAALFVCALSAQAGKTDPDKLKSFDFEINLKTIEEINKAVNGDAIVKKYNLSMPILPPRLDEEQVAALVSKEVESLVEARYPKSQFKQIEIDAKHKFRRYKLNDMVSVRVLDVRRKIPITVTKKIRKITPKGVLLGDQFFIYRDIDKGEYPHFFKTHHDRAVDSEIRAQTTFYRNLRKSYKKEIGKKTAKKIWRDEGYIYRKSKKKWVPREDVFNHLLQREWVKKFGESSKEVETLVVEGHGFVWNEALQQWELPGKGDDDDDDDKVATSDKPKKTVSESLSAFGEQLKDLFKKDDGDQAGDDDIWGEGDEGDAEDKPKKEPETKKPEK